MSTGHQGGASRPATLVVLATVMLLAPRAAADPTIKITSVPEYGGSGVLQGVVSGVPSAQYQVAPYIQIEGVGWWTKPTLEAPTLPINGDGTFTGNVFAGGLDNRATIFCAALIPVGVTPPAATSSGRLPANLNPVALDCLERFGRTITFAGRTWAVKESPLPVGPGGNRFSDRTDDVWVDSDGLHLTIRERDGEWWSSEVILLDSLGYGTYAVKTRSRTDILDVNATLGIFTWDPYGDNEAPGSPHREIDFEDSRWWGAGDPNTQAVVQPWDVPGNRHRFNLPDLSADSRLTRIFEWKPSAIKFLTLAGHHSSKRYPAASVINQWTYRHEPTAQHYVPAPGRESVRLNLWLTQAAPATGETIEVVITDFSFVDAGTGDFDGNSAADLIWQEDGTNVPAVWFMGGGDGSTPLGAKVLAGPVPGWRIVGVADLDGNAVPDLIWQEDGTNVPAVWYMGGGDGSALLGAKVLSGPVPGWRVVGVSDLDGNGVPDLIWQEDGTNAPGVWYLRGVDGSIVFSAKALSGPIPGWRIVGVADLDGNGTPDLIWQAVGSNVPAVWYMGGGDGSTTLGAKVLYGTVPGWKIVGVSDLDGNGAPDLIWQEDGTNVPAVWYMGGADGSAMLGARTLSASVPGWRIAGPK